MVEMVTECEKWSDEWDVAHRWLGSDERNDGGIEGEVLEMEGAIQEQGAEGEPREDKSGNEWGRRWSVCKLQGRSMWYLWEVSNGKFSVVCEMQEINPWKMYKSKEGDPKIEERFCVWKMQEASWWISGTSGGVVWRGGNGERFLLFGG